MKKTILILMLVFISNAMADDHDLSGKTYPVKNIIIDGVELPEKEIINLGNMPRQGVPIVDKNFKECKLKVDNGPDIKIDPAVCKALGI